MLSRYYFSWYIALTMYPGFEGKNEKRGQLGGREVRTPLLIRWDVWHATNGVEENTVWKR